MKDVVSSGLLELNLFVSKYTGISNFPPCKLKISPPLEPISARFAGKKIEENQFFVVYFISLSNLTRFEKQIGLFLLVEISVGGFCLPKRAEEIRRRKKGTLMEESGSFTATIL